MAYDYNSRLKWEKEKLEEWDKENKKKIGRLSREKKELFGEVFNFSDYPHCGFPVITKWGREKVKASAGKLTLKEILYKECPEIIDILVPELYREDFDYMLDQFAYFQYSRSLFRPTVRTADPAAHMPDAFGLMQGYKVLGIYGITPLEYLTEKRTGHGDTPIDSELLDFKRSDTFARKLHMVQFEDILAAASSNANTNVSMMGETFKYCAPIAGAMGYSAEDTAQAIGLMANSGIKGSQAGTALRTIMTKLQGDLKLSGAAFGDMTIKTANADGSMRDFNDILADCRVAFGQMTESEKAAAAETLVGKNAMSGFLALMNAAPEDIEKLEGAIGSCSDEIDGYNGTAEKMAAVMQDNLNGQLTIMLMPTIRKVVSAIQGFVDKLNGMSEGQRNAILKVGLFVAALGPFLVILGTCISKIGIAMQGFVKLAGAVGKMKTAMSAGTGIMGKLGAALGGISAPVLIVVGVIAVLVAAFIHLWKTNDGFREAIIGTWERIKTAISGFVEGIKERLGALGISFSGIAETIKKIWNGLCSVLAPVFEGAFSVIASVLETVLGVITGLLDVFIGVFTGNWDQAWTGVKEIFSSVWNGIKGIFTAVIGTIRGIADAVLSWFGTNWNEAWTGIKSFFEGIWNGIATFFTNIWTGITTTVTTVLTGIKTFFVTIWEGIKGVVTGAMTAIQTTMSSIWSAISGVVSTVWETIKSVVQVGILFIKELLTAALNCKTSTRSPRPVNF